MDTRKLQQDPLDLVVIEEGEEDGEKIEGDKQEYYQNPQHKDPQVRLEYAVPAYAKALRQWERYIASLKPGEKSKILRPSLRRFAEEFQVDRMTLSRRLNGETQPHSIAHRDAQRLTWAEEVCLVDWIRQLERWNFPPLVSRVVDMAHEILKARGDYNPLGKHWIQKFFLRAPELNTRWSQPLDKDRCSGMTYEIVNDWFELIEGVQKEYHIEKADTYNMDEKGFNLGSIGKEKVACTKENVHVYINEPTNREWVSLIECISADGRILPVFIIFKAKIMLETWMLALEKEGKICLSDKGWTDNYLGLQWFKQVFHPQTKKTLKGEYRLLIVDGHASHVTSEVIIFCRQEKIILACLPPHTTHALQPLDVSFFLPLSNNYRRRLVKKFDMRKNVAVTKADFVEIYQAARQQIAKESTICHAWEKSGLFPADRNRILWKLNKPHEMENSGQTSCKASNKVQRPFTPPDVFAITSEGARISVRQTKTPQCKKDAIAIVHRIINNQHTLGDAIKLGKCLEITYAKVDILQITNKGLVEIENDKIKTGKRSTKQLGKGRIMGTEVLQERDRTAQAKEEAKKAKASDKLFLDSLTSMRMLWLEPKSQSPKKRPTLKPTQDQPATTIDSAPPLLAPLNKPNQTGDPVRMTQQGTKKAQKAQKAQKTPVAQATEAIDKEVVVVTRSGRRSKPKHRS
jgi:hypothetical protein